MADVAFTAQSAASILPIGSQLSPGSAEEARGSLDQWLRQGRAPAFAAGTVDTVDPPVVFLFPGQTVSTAAWAANCGKRRRCSERPPGGARKLSANWRLRAKKERKQARRGEGNAPADRESLISPALRLFALEYALAELWKSWGIVPAAVLGHGVGQYAAACTAGVFSLEDGLKLVAARGRLVATLPGDGRMLAVMAGPARVADVSQRLGNPQSLDLAIAAMNSPRQTVVPAGPRRSSGWPPSSASSGFGPGCCPVSHAAHWPAVEPFAGEFGRVCRDSLISQTGVPVISSISGKPAGEEIAGPDYWPREVLPAGPLRRWNCHARRTGLSDFLGDRAAAEVAGPGRRCMRQWAGLWLPSLKRGQPAWQVLLSSLAKLYAQGVKIDWTGLHRGQPRRRAVLPTYPFQRQRYWLAEPGGKRGQGPFVRSTRRAVPAKGACPLFCLRPGKRQSGAARGGVEIARIILRRRGPAAAARAAGIGQTADTKAGKGLGRAGGGCH